MNKITKVWLLSLIAIVQALTLVGGFIVYEQMSETISRLDRNYHELLWETYPWLRMGPGLPPPDPFAALPLVLLGQFLFTGLFLTVGLLINELHHKNGTVMQKSWKIGLALILMFLTAIPTFLFLASVLFLIDYFFKALPIYELQMIPEGYYLLPLSGLCTTIFFASLIVSIKTIKSKKEMAS